MHKSLGLLVVILCCAVTLQNNFAIAQSDSWECPLDKKRPETEDIWLDYVEPMEFQVETAKQKSAAAKLVERLNRVSEALEAFNKRMLTPPPTKPSEEFRQALDEVSKLALQTIFRADQSKEEKELNQDNAAVGRAMDHLVRTFIAMDKEIERMLHVSDNTLKLPKSVLDFSNRLKSVMGEERALRAKRSNKRICEFLKAEKKRRCEIEPFRGMGDKKPEQAAPSEEEIKKAELARSEVENQISGLYRSINAEFDDKKNIWERMSGLFKKSKHQSEKLESEHRDNFYKKVAPFFKLCGSYAGLQGYKRRSSILPPPSYQKVCAPFLCEGGNLLMDPEKNPVWAEKGFCRFAKSGADYDAMEEEYLGGFIEEMNSTSNTVSFCPTSTTAPSARHPDTDVHRRKP